MSAHRMPANDLRPRRWNAETARRSNERDAEAPSLPTNVTLSLIRVQSSAVAARGRGLVRFFTDLTERPIPAVATCERCERMVNVSVDLRDASNPVVLHLPSNCRACGHPMDDYRTIRDLIGSARLYAETAHLVNQFEPDGGAA